MNYSTHLLRHLRYTIGQNIQRQRTNRRMTLDKLSRLSGIPESLLDRYEIGKHDIRLEDTLRIACALRLEAKELLQL